MSLLLLAVLASAAMPFGNVEIALPNDPTTLPPGPGLDAVRENCGACHSPSTMLQQPKLSREKWQAQIDKMVKVYKAPVEPSAVPAIIDYLVAAQAQD